MKRSTARWTGAIAAAALFVAPAAGRGQTPQTPSPSTQESRPSSDHSRQGTASHGAPNEHLQKAEAALNDIPAASLTGTAKTRIAELKRHISKLEESAGAHAGHGAAATGGKDARTAAKPSTAKGTGGWTTEVAAVDRILSELLGSQGMATANQPTGTSGTAADAPANRSRAAGGATLDETTRAKLQEVRTHMTAFAASMSGSASATTSSDDPSTTAAASAQAAPTTPPATAHAPDASAPATATTPTAAPQGSAAGETANATGSTGSASAQSPASTHSANTAPSANAAQSAPAPTGTSGMTAAPTDAASPSQAGQPAQGEAEAVKRHLTAARESLSQLTQLPAAAQLTGDARTQVSQLISNFNELITTNVDWRASYAKVQGNLQTLIGDQHADESPTPAAGNPGAVGTSGAVTVDPAIRTKLIEFRTHLSEFEKVAGGTTASSSDPATSATAPTPAEAAAAAASSGTPAASGTSASAPRSTGAEAGATSGIQGATGTSGTTTSGAASAGTRDSGTPDAARSAASQGRDEAHASHSEAMRHIEAIEAILNGRPAGTAGTTGTSGNASPNRPASSPSDSSSSTGSGPAALDRAQIEQIKTHLAELKKGLSKSGDR